MLTDPQHQFSPSPNSNDNNSPYPNMPGIEEVSL